MHRHQPPLMLAIDDYTTISAITPPASYILLVINAIVYMLRPRSSFWHAFAFFPALIPCLRSFTFETSFSVCLLLTAGFNEFDVNHCHFRRSLRFAAAAQ